MFTALQAQEIVKGVVRDDMGDPLPGAYIESESGQSAETDVNGKYTITAKQGEKLTFSYIGKKDLTKKVIGNTLNVKLIGQANLIGETVVVGYQSKNKRDINSAISTINADELHSLTPSTSIDNILQGKASGVDVTALNGKPGNTATVKIRGALSLNVEGGVDRSAPLYVVDGMYVNGVDLNQLNPNDIANVSVLKDASSAAIYGSRGANGVVIITTKKGKKGKTRFSISSRLGTAEKIKDPFKLMNASQKIQYENELSQIINNKPAYDEEEVKKLIAYNHDWRDDILKKASIQSQSFSASGGTEKSTYYYSLGYDKNTGIVESLDGFERITAKLSNSVNLTDKFSVNVDLTGSYSTSDEPRDRFNVQNPFFAAYTYNPYTPVFKRDEKGQIVKDSDGQPSYSMTKQGFPILEALKNNTEERRHFRLLGTVGLSYNLLKNLSFTTRYAGNYDRYQRENYMKPGSVLDTYVGDKKAPGSKTDRGHDNFSYNWYNGMAYKKSFDKHHFDALVFSEFFKENYYYTSFSSKGFASPKLITQDVSSEPTGASSSRSKYTLFSIAGTFSYDYMKKYFLTASLRRDGSSRFGKDQRYGNFWSSSLAWNIARENFLQSANFLDDLKLRLSYGTLGNTNLPDYAAQGYYTFYSYSGASAAYPHEQRVGNPSLTWEKQKSFNTGLEYNLFKNRLTGVVDYFINTRSDFLFDSNLSYEAAGYHTSQYINAGEMETNGLELQLSADLIRNEHFKWTLGANISFLNYNINELPKGTKGQIVVDGDNIIKTGEEPFTYYLVRYAGVDPETGDALYLDKKGKKTNKYSADDKVVLSGKSPLPDYYGGLNTNFDYKGFYLNADFSFKHGNYIYNNVAAKLLQDGMKPNENQRVDALNYWKKKGDTGVLPRLNSDSSQTSDRFLQDGSYIRFRNLTLGYNFPAKMIRKTGLTGLSIFIQMQNLYTWTDFEGDPEVSIGSGESQIGGGLNFIPGSYSAFSYPATKSWTFGIDLTF